MGIMGIAAGPDGSVYGATYYNASLFRVDPVRAAVESLGRVKDAAGEFRVLYAMGRRVFLPGYGGALYVYDVDRPWDARGPAVNPWRLGEIGHGQHLATAVDADGDELAIATPPGYGLRGGALTLLDTRSLSWRTFTDLVPDQSFTAVSLRDGALCGGTSVEVGSGETVRARSAHIVVADARTGTIRYDIVVADATAITSLVELDRDRLLAGTDNGNLIELEATTGKTRVVARLPHIRQLWAWPGRNVVIGIGWRRGLFLVDPRSLAVRWIEGSPDKLVPGMAADAQGRVYLHDGTRIYRMTSG
jgi:outer membrane protein assembly factor BamB